MVRFLIGCLNKLLVPLPHMTLTFAPALKLSLTPSIGNILKRADCTLTV